MRETFYIAYLVYFWIDREIVVQKKTPNDFSYTLQPFTIRWESRAYHIGEDFGSKKIAWKSRLRPQDGSGTIIIS